jgi:hypothetical protein
LCAAHRIHATGLDIVPLQPDLHRMGLSDWASRITWVQANLCDVPSCPSRTFTELPSAVLMGCHFPMMSLILCSWSQDVIVHHLICISRHVKRIARGVPEHQVSSLSSSVSTTMLMGIWKWDSFLEVCSPSHR